MNKISRAKKATSRQPDWATGGTSGAKKGTTVVGALQEQKKDLMATFEEKTQKWSEPVIVKERANH